MSPKSLSREVLLVFHRALLPRWLTRYGGHWGNKIPRVDQNQHHCLVVKEDLQRLGEETPIENQLAQRFRRQRHNWDKVLWANNPHSLNVSVKETQMRIKRTDSRGNPFGVKWTTRIGVWNVRTLREYGKLERRNAITSTEKIWQEEKIPEEWKEGLQH